MTGSETITRSAPPFHGPLTDVQCKRRNFLQHVVNCRQARVPCEGANGLPVVTL